MKNKHLILILIALAFSACTPQTSLSDEVNNLKIVATTSIVADVVAQVGGGLVDVQILLPEGADPHSFEPTPQDIAKVADADLIFAHGAGLEAFIENLLESAGAEEKIVEVAEGIELLGEFRDEHDDEDHPGDPHTWTDPNNVIIWVENIESVLIREDAINAEAYAENADAYIAELKDIDIWIRGQISEIPLENRQIVTDHLLLGYYVDEYGLEQVGAIIPGYSSLSEPSAQELAEIENAIRELEVKAIFVGKTVNPNLAERIAEDTDIQLVYFYTGSLSASGGEASTYLDYLRYNTGVFVKALK